MQVTFRRTGAGDVDWMRGLVDGADADMERAVADPSVVAIVASAGGVSQGFLLGKMVTAPPVYDPGGPVCLVDQVACVDGWSQTAASLIGEAGRQVREQGGVLLRVVCARGDVPKEQWLAGLGFRRASEWFVGATSSVAMAAGADGQIRKAEAADLDRILELGDGKRDEYATYQPVFWRKSAASPSTFKPYLEGVLRDPRTTALVHIDDAGAVDGFLIAAGGYIDDFVVMPSSVWSTIGVALIRVAAGFASEKGIESFTIVCGHNDRPKSDAIASLGFDLVRDWHILDLPRR